MKSCLKIFALTAVYLWPFNAIAENSHMVFIPEGPFIMGSDKTDNGKKSQEFGSGKPWYLDEHPQHNVTLPSFYLDKFEVTNGQYRDFITATNGTIPDYWNNAGYAYSLDSEKLDAAPLDILQKLARTVLRLDMDTRQMSKEALLTAIKEHFLTFSSLPVTFVSWQEANDYCHWARKRLPQEAEWEKAARGKNGQEFPWGNDWQAGASNAGGEDWEYGASPVGAYNKDQSPYAVMDMAGNVSEWVEDWYDGYPDSKEKSDLFGKKYRVARGAGWSNSGHYALEIYSRSAYRLNLNPDSRFNDVGFRCASNH